MGNGGTESSEYAIDLANRAHHTALNVRNGFLNPAHRIVKHHFRPFHLDLGAGGGIGQEFVHFRYLLLGGIEDRVACVTDLVDVLLDSLDGPPRRADDCLNLRDDRHYLFLKLAGNQEQAEKSPGLYEHGDCRQSDENYEENQKDLLVHVGAPGS